ncbi:hypothetical protein AMJ71_09645 [candidate division TA06 bacterium SM1_40]|uniref:Uncharacterized protein n=1 Tax=candidate division TA06 bacterium SM1_40 TaxID=1703773 RepID=A0A0S8JCW7_UNCT6|nr:MAG: hypothetical protein AMJ71_09645 [candidate division TA06 bacterium SM1_40]
MSPSIVRSGATVPTCRQMEILFRRGSYTDIDLIQMWISHQGQSDRDIDLIQRFRTDVGLTPT